MPSQAEYRESSIDGQAIVDVIEQVQSLTPDPAAGFALASIVLKEIYWRNFEGTDKSDDHLIEQFRIAIQSMRPETERLQ